MTVGRLDRAERTRALDRMAGGTAATPVVDVVVVGGGVTGAGAALDAASRGLTVALLEQDDWASGTSSRSSRLAHGGLRYLEQMEFGLVHEALTERGLLLETLAPHLVRPVPFLFPLTRGWERPYVGAGVALYDALSRVGRRVGTLPGHRHLSRRATLRLVPSLRPDAIAGSVGYFDAQIDDARHTLALVRTAVAQGALAASRVRVVGFVRDGDRVVGVEAEDLLTGRELRVHARVVVAATGVWGTHTRHLLGGAGPHEEPVQPSKGVHLVVPRETISSHTAIITRTPVSVLFLLPWGRHWLVGTTDTPWDGPLDSPTVTEEDVAYLLDQANRWLVRPLTRDDVVGVYAGLRPLIAAEGAPAEETPKMSREHVVTRPAPGYVSIAGGKYTTYRVMARDVVDAAVGELVAALRPGPSRTAALPLVGAAGFAELWARREEVAAEQGLSVPATAHLLRRHGDQVFDVLERAAGHPRLLEPLHPDAPYLRAEVLHAAAAEGALTVEDVLTRRTRIAVETRDGGAAVAAEVEGLLDGSARV